MKVNLSRVTIICWMPSWNLSIRFAMNGPYQMRESRSLSYLARSSTFLFYEFSKLRKAHKPRPGLTAESLRSVMGDDGVMHSGISLDGTRIWNIFESILWIYDIEESADVPHAHGPY